MSDEPTQDDAATTRSWAGYAVLILVIALIILTAGFIYLSRQQGAVPGMAGEALGVLDARLENLDKGVARYEERIAALEKEMKAVTSEVSSLKAAPVEGVASAVAGDDAPTPEGTAEPAPPAADTAVQQEQAKRLEALEKEISAFKASTPAFNADHIAHSIKLLSAFHRLSNNVLAGKAYADSLSDFEDLIGDSTSQNKPLADLATYADNGVPTLAELLTSFDNSVEQFSSAQAVPPPEAGAWDRFVFNMKNLVRVRRIDEAQTGQDADAIVGRAAANLDKGQIEASIAEINRLPDAVKNSFTGWLEDAQIALDAQGMIDELEEQVMGQVFQPQEHKAPEAIQNQGLNIQ